MNATDVRKGTPDVKLDHDTFIVRYREQFYDPNFEAHVLAIEELAEVAWQNYSKGRKSPRTKPAGPGFADPSYRLSDEWRATSEAIKCAEEQQKNSSAPRRVLLISGAPRNEHTCPGEMSKTHRLAQAAKKIFDAQPGSDFLDLSRITSEYGRKIYPCKTCVSTAMPLCHWPCSCYPNHSLGQVQDWMKEIYPMWAAAHGVMIISPVNWYHAPTALKSMMDRLVCADGGNSDPTSTQGKNAQLAKELELKGWPYPKHLAGRLFSVICHGDSAGAESMRRNMVDWLSDMGLIFVEGGSIDKYIGYLKPYATSHADLDQDENVWIEIENAAHALVKAILLRQQGKFENPVEGLIGPRPK